MSINHNRCISLRICQLIPAHSTWHHRLLCLPFPSICGHSAIRSARTGAIQLKMYRCCDSIAYVFVMSVWSSLRIRLFGISIIYEHMSQIICVTTRSRAHSAQVFRHNYILYIEISCINNLDSCRLVGTSICISLHKKFMRIRMWIYHEAQPCGKRSWVIGLTNSICVPFLNLLQLLWFWAVRDVGMGVSLAWDSWYSCGELKDVVRISSSACIICIK